MVGYKHEDHTVDIGDKDAMDFYAHLSQASYEGDDADAKDQYLEQHIGDGWKMDGEMSNQDRSVFVKPKSDGEGYNVVMANRGTDIANRTGNRMRNLMTDASIFFGAEPRSQRFKKANTDFLKTREKYGTDSNYSVSGHSLGGAVSLYLNRRYGVESHVQNPGASFSHMAKGAITKAMCWFNPNHADCKAADNSTIYHQVGDPISTASMVGRDKKVLANSNKSKTGYNPHSLTHFYKENQKGSGKTR
jgi:hypothetical protein